MKDLFKIRKISPILYLIYAAIIGSGVAIDQFTKYIAATDLSKISTYPIIEGVIHLTYVENRGAAFGMLADHRYIFMIVSTVMILALSAYVFLGMCPSPRYSSAICLIISGGIGNMIDRIALGYVVDFIDFRLINFAVFNGADSLVCIGAGLLCLFMIWEAVLEERAKSRDNNNKV